MKSLRLRLSRVDDEMSDVGRPCSDRVSATEIGSQSMKTWFEFVFAAIMLVIFSPIIILSMVLVRVTSRGSWIYCQTRIGQGGRVFTLYKIRTMYQDSEREGARWCVPGDPRVTPIGRILRWSHLDELPQLVNVLKGEMSLVGPRPERPEFVAQLERAIPEYRRRLSVKAGLTGLAQIQQPPDTDLESVRRKLEYDLCYIEQMSLWLDARLMVGTVFKCLGVPFSWIGRVLHLPDPIAQRDRNIYLLQELDLPAKSMVSDSYVS